jgi:16S rRNA (guanine(966)-N(2))-methyltransferase RsmD
MLRVVGGSAKGRKLKAPKGLKIRPTSERVREALFDILGLEIIGASFLDLFAGTGAVGIEALSRGAGKVVFVEKDNHIRKIIRENLSICGFSEQVRIWAKDARMVLDSYRFKPFDIIFIDPPYDSTLANACLARLDRMAEKVKTVIIEQNPRQVEAPYFPKHLQHIRDYRYGSTVLCLFSGKIE